MTTIPRLMSFLTNFSLALADFKQRQANSPAQASCRETLLTWIDFTTTDLNCLSLSGPIKQVLLRTTTPDLIIPDTTKPTPSTKKFSLIQNSKGWPIASSIVIVLGLSMSQMKCVSASNPILETLDTGKIGQTFPEGISSAVFISSFSDVLSVISIAYLFKSLCLKIFLNSSRVSQYLFWGAMSTLVSTMKKGIFKKRQSPICSLVIFCMPMFAPTTTQPKSGESPVSPLMVVLRYFQCPQRSTNEIILQLLVTTSFQYLFLFWLNLSGRTCFPSLVNPIISCPIELVRPVSCSWRQLRTLTRAPPLPSSGIPLVKTETRVDLPASTLPMMPILTNFYGRSSYFIMCDIVNQIQKNCKIVQDFYYTFNRLTSYFTGFRQIDLYYLYPLRVKALVPDDS